MADLPLTGATLHEAFQSIPKLDPAMDDHIVLTKTWIQAPPDSTPIDFEEVWHLDGSTRKDNAKARFLQVKEHIS